MDLKELERIIYFDQHVVTETTIPEQIPLRKLMTDDELQEARELWGGEEVFSTNIGAEGVQELLETLDLEELQQQLQIEMEETNSESTRRKITKRLKLVNAFIKSGNNPAWMVLKTLPVLPPELRPCVYQIREQPSLDGTEDASRVAAGIAPTRPHGRRSICDL